MRAPTANEVDFHSTSIDRAAALSWQASFQL